MRVARECKKIVAEILVAGIFDKHRRRHVRHILRTMEPIKNLVDFFRFLLEKKRGEILYIEPSDAHGEIAPGYLYYFIKAGYRVDVVLDSAVAEEHPLCGMLPHPSIRLFSTNVFFLKKWLSVIARRNYKLIFISTSQLYQKDGSLFCNEFESFCVENANRLLLVEHNLNNVPHSMAEYDLYRQGKLSVITNFNRDKHLLELNPSYFGSFPEKEEKANKPVFLIVGGFDLSRRNPRLVIDAIRFLLKKGYDQFEVVAVGSENFGELPQDIQSFIHIRGRVNYPDMFSEMCRADFFLPLFDPTLEEHIKYKETVSSGSIQLILGFSVPALIDETFATAYGFNKENALLYCDNQLGERMVEAIQMNQEEWSQMRENIKAYREEKYRSGIACIKSCIERAYLK